MNNDKNFNIYISMNTFKEWLIKESKKDKCYYKLEIIFYDCFN